MPASKVQCPNCGASVPPTGACGFCGAAAFVDGISGNLLPSSLKCPRCPRRPELRGLEHEGIRADLCMECHGVWFGLGQLEEALRTAAQRPPAPGEGARGPAHGGLEPVRYTRCPVCDGGMARNALARKPLVIVDRCPAHGDWCDGGELAQLKFVARTRGMEAIGAKEPTRAADRAVDRKGERLPTVDFPIEPRTGSMFRTGSGPDFFDVLWDFFFKP